MSTAKCFETLSVGYLSSHKLKNSAQNVKVNYELVIFFSTSKSCRCTQNGHDYVRIQLLRMSIIRNKKRVVLFYHTGYKTTYQ